LCKEKEKNENLGKELNLGPSNSREILTIASDLFLKLLLLLIFYNVLGFVQGLCKRNS